MHINSARRRCAIMLGALACLAASPARSQAAWPDRPIHIVTPFSAGGPGDDSARLIGDALSKALKQPVVIDNKPGAGGIIGADAVAKAAPDGYTLLAAANGTLINSLIRAKMPYPANALVPVTGVSAAPSLLVVDPGMPASNLRELQAVAKKESNGIFFATTGIGSTSHFVGEMIKVSLGIPLTFVQYKSGGESSMALHSKQVQMLAEVPSASLVGLVKSGAVKALAVASDQRMAILPDVPSTAEAGFPGIKMTHWLGLMAPAGTPPAVLDRISSAAQAWLATPAAREALAMRNAEPMMGDRKQFGAFIDNENLRLGKIARELKIVAE